MRAAPTPIHYLVGTPRGRLTKLEKALAAKPWEDVRESVRVKLIEDGEETYVLARSEARREKEQAMRRRRLLELLERLHELQRQELTRDELLLELGAAKKDAGKAYGLMTIHTPTKDQPVTPQTFHFTLDLEKLRVGHGGARAAISCVPTSRATIPAISGGYIRNWSRSSKRSKN